MGRSTTTTTQSADPTTLARENQLWNSANALPSTFTPYGGQQVAGMTPQQQTAFGQIAGAANQAQGGIQQAMGMISPYSAQQVAGQGYAPTLAQGGSQVNAGNIGLGGWSPGMVGASNVSAQAFPDANLASYMNPYIGNVVDTTNADIERQRQTAIASGQAQATAAGAYGGSRHGVSDSLTNEAAGRTTAMTDAQLRSAGYTQAAQQIAQDQSRNLQGQMANQSAGLQAGMANQQAGYQGAALGLNAAQANQGANLQAQLANSQMAQNLGLANAGFQNNAGQFNAQLGQNAALANQSAGLQAAGLNNQSAGLLGNLAAQGQTSALEGANANYMAGTAQQANQQQGLDTAYNSWLQQQQFPYQYQQFLQGFRGTPGQTGTQVAPSQLPGQILGAAASLNPFGWGTGR